MRQALQAIGILQRIAQGGNVLIPGFGEACFHRLVVRIAAVQGDGGSWREIMLFGPVGELLIAHEG
ncbi:hypothetical protein D3C76_1680860 [compost metagenome]